MLIEESNSSKKRMVRRSNCARTLTTTPRFAAALTSANASERQRCKIPNWPSKRNICSSTSSAIFSIRLKILERSLSTAKRGPKTSLFFEDLLSLNVFPDCNSESPSSVLLRFCFLMSINLCTTTSTESQLNFIGRSAATMTMPISCNLESEL